MTASTPTTLLKAKLPRATEAEIEQLLNRSWRRHVQRYDSTGVGFTSDHLITDVLDALDRRGADTGLWAVQELLAVFVRDGLLLGDKAAEISRRRGNVIPFRHAST